MRYGQGESVAAREPHVCCPRLTPLAPACPTQAKLATTGTTCTTSSGDPNCLRCDGVWCIQCKTGYQFNTAYKARLGAGSGEGPWMALAPHMQSGGCWDGVPAPLPTRSRPACFIPAPPAPLRTSLCTPCGTLVLPVWPSGPCTVYPTKAHHHTPSYHSSYLQCVTGTVAHLSRNPKCAAINPDGTCTKCTGTLTSYLTRLYLVPLNAIYLNGPTPDSQVGGAE